MRLATPLPLELQEMSSNFFLYSVSLTKADFSPVSGSFDVDPLMELVLTLSLASFQ